PNAGRNPPPPQERKNRTDAGISRRRNGPGPTARGPNNNAPHQRVRASFAPSRPRSGQETPRRRRRQSQHHGGRRPALQGGANGRGRGRASAAPARRRRRCFARRRRRIEGRHRLRRPARSRRIDQRRSQELARR
ncbi:hypothetical protein BRADI_4g44385v3, partial [Brachypodium distachyon]